MTAIDAATAVEAINDNSSAGQRLRGAREQLDLSIRDVASALNLMVSHVRGIETDRYAELTNDRQFLRHLHEYATLVELDANEVVDLYRSQSAAVAAQIEARPGKHSKQYDSKWYGVGALAVACICLGIWALNQTLPSNSASDMANPNNETLVEKPAAAPPKGKVQVAKNTAIDVSKSSDSIANSASITTTITSDEGMTPRKEEDTRDASKITARSDQAALETRQVQSGKKAVNTVATNNIPGKNALLVIGAKPLKKTLVKLKNEV
ncbi:MAG: helix-turn-helix domain-containing protein [Pseudomonadales bacterium]